jgi:hypothetical protein
MAPTTGDEAANPGDASGLFDELVERIASRPVEFAIGVQVAAGQRAGAAGGAIDRRNPRFRAPRDASNRGESPRLFRSGILL